MTQELLWIQATQVTQAYLWVSLVLLMKLCSTQVFKDNSAHSKSWFFLWSCRWLLKRARLVTRDFSSLKNILQLGKSIHTYFHVAGQRFVCNSSHADFMYSWTICMRQIGRIQVWHKVSIRWQNNVCYAGSNLTARLLVCRFEHTAMGGGKH